MKYFLDCEFQEAFHKPLFGKSRHFIDLISIALVAEDGREYFAVSNEFYINKVWRDEWLRENVLRQLHRELVKRESTYAKNHHGDLFMDFTKRSIKTLIRWHGQSNKEIAKTIQGFIKSEPAKMHISDSKVVLTQESKKNLRKGYLEPEFYGYYCDYDWVLLCSLFGRMINLPKGFPMYCKDLQQNIDEFGVETVIISKDIQYFIGPSREKGLGSHERVIYPADSGGHHALDDAKWIKGLYDFIQTNYKN